MLLSGIQKLTLLDYPGLTACTVFTGGCNLRCPFCHNASLVLPGRSEGRLSEDELIAFLKKREGVLDAVVVSGGEPLLHDDLPELLGRIKALGYLVKLDTNGTLPPPLAGILASGLADYVAMDVKNSPELYARTAGCEAVDLAALEASRDLLMGGKTRYEFRTTVVKGLHTVESIEGAARWIAGARAYYLQQFRDSGDLVDAAGLGAFSSGEMLSMAEAARRYVPSAQARGI